MVLLLAAALCAGITAAIAEALPQGNALLGGLEDGNYVVRIPCTQEEASFWAAEDDPNEEKIVSLVFAGWEDGAFTARYAPGADDGEITLDVTRFDDRGAAREIYSFDLRVRDGAMLEPAGGAYEAAPSDEELDPYIAGEWRQEETQWESLFAERNPEGGWDIEIISPLTHGAAVFLGNFRFSCGENALVCTDGALYEAPITDGETEAGYGALISDGLYARIFLLPDSEAGDNLKLDAYTDMHEDGPVTFVRVEAEEN